MATEFHPEVGLAMELGHSVRRILAPNPSPMTFHGTNTYLVGHTDIAVIDPGPDSREHATALIAALKPGQRITHILITHSHLDHSPLARSLAVETGAPIYGFGDSLAGMSPAMAGLSRDEIGGGEGIDDSFVPDMMLADGDQIAGPDWKIEALHTPGHFGNHMCFGLVGTGYLFSGDLVMGWATSMVSPPDGDLTQFRTSLQRLLSLTDEVYHPGHGPEIRDPKGRVQELLKHRQTREDQIVAALRNGPATPAELTSLIYTDTPVALHPAAARNVLAHLIDLHVRKKVLAEHKLSRSSRFSLS